MARRINAPVGIRLRPSPLGGDEPAEFTWQGRRYRVDAVTLVHKRMGRWWDGEGERTYFRVAASPAGAAAGEGGLYELCYRHERREWLLWAILD